MHQVEMEETQECTMYQVMLKKMAETVELLVVVPEVD